MSGDLKDSIVNNGTRLRACLVDDEKYCLATLNSDLDLYFPEIEIVGVFQKPLLALDFLQQEDIDILFLDIDMPLLSGLELAEKFPNPTFEIVFTTAYDQHAAKAFRLDAADYLLKPIALEELKVAVEKIKQRISLKKKDNNPQKIFLSDSKGIELIDLEQILYCEADKNYCTFYFVNGKSKVVSKNIGHFEKLLDPKTFFRIHQSYLVNTNKIKKIGRTLQPFVILSNGRQLTISRANKSDFYKFLESKNTSD